MATMNATRQTASPIRLLLQAAGGPEAWAGKASRLARTLSLYLNSAEVQRRFEKLRERGYIQHIPNRFQLAVGGLDMVRFVIAPGAEDYYRTRGINFTFHQVLRFLDDPVSIIDPVGVLSDRDTIIGHLMQVTHLNPVYDLQLLEMFDDGLAELEHQVRQMLEGTHPRAKTIGAIVEDPTYHQRLLDFVVAFRANRNARPPVREDGGIRQSPDFCLAEATFAELPSFIRYANRLPQRLPALLSHLRHHSAIQHEHCEPEVVARFVS